MLEKQCTANTLHKRGFVSSGCAPCTRAISEDEDIRGRRDGEGGSRVTRVRIPHQRK
jgi:3'-phosphoadenosine 5'-phosphosulfate sulfotransferase (PAPS reductase)/FAD synthetase